MLFIIIQMKLELRLDFFILNAVVSLFVHICNETNYGLEIEATMLLLA